MSLEVDIEHYKRAYLVVLEGNDCLMEAIAIAAN